jgi:hypothetical protein
MKIEKYTNYVVEKLDLNDIEQRLGDKYGELKNGLITLMEESLKTTKEDNVNMIDIENFIGDYISSGKDANMIDGVIEDNDIFNFYLKYQSDIDELLNDTKYMDTTPKSNGVYSLYDVVIDGTKQSVLEALKMIRKDLFKKK